MERRAQTIEDLLRELEETRQQLYEAEETIEAIRTGQVDALVVHSEGVHQLYTLQSADHAYRVFIEKMSEGAITLNESGLVLYANTQFATMIGHPLSGIIGLPFRNFLTPESHPAYDELFSASWSTDVKAEVELLGTGSRVPVQLSSTALELIEGISLCVIITDLTAQKNVRQQLEHSNRELDQLNKSLEASNHDLQQFASVASHDLQEPLRKIQIFTNILSNSCLHKLNADETRYLNKVTASASRMKELIRDVLNYSKLSASEERFTRTDLDVIVKELLEDLELMITERGARISNAGLPSVDANPGQMRQVFQNLLSNALKFSRPGIAPEIRITGRKLLHPGFDSVEHPEGPYCLISIQDNGIGFDEKYIYKIFSLFERLHTKEHYEGTGIGLAITKKIVDKHRGLIQVHSTEGVGTCFEIILPVLQPEKKPA
ncbi:sensor histidine kinase [Flaviaesturariibacter amylovorans]|uniref:histidine kinase n=1 Tax=Flaviaesturariibacter amylovorans TaxID=1084520 RepID=A0ABP8GFN3_9BACT